MNIIRENKEKSPMFNGQINAVGARYCPSIEDKAYRYPDKDIHHVFVEPESHYLETMYPSGISTSLPKEVQQEMVNSIVGLEKAKIAQYGYAVEYDVVDTTQLNLTLEMKSTPGLYFAGQVNGTSGYEEAAGQGLVAGANAALSLLGRDPLILSRNDSYIGVMIEDLISNVRDEPYRLFTARSENRLYIREDNALLRMKTYREGFGLATELDSFIKLFYDQYKVFKNLLENFYVNPDDNFCKIMGIKVPRRTSMAEVLKQPEINLIEVASEFFNYSGLKVNERIIRTIAIAIKYDGYIAKSDLFNSKSDKLATKKISYKFLLESENISFECKKRIERIKPETFGQLKIIEGIRPATLAAVAGNLT
jgi:tRNA uridine 5-carboxymethylaminomethyl modification enzyme